MVRWKAVMLVDHWVASKVASKADNLVEQMAVWTVAQSVDKRVVPSAVRKVERSARPRAGL